MGGHPCTMSAIEVAVEEQAGVGKGGCMIFIVYSVNKGRRGSEIPKKICGRHEWMAHMDGMNERERRPSMRRSAGHHNSVISNFNQGS